MEMMIRRDPITGLYENVPVPDQEITLPENNNINIVKSSVQYNKVNVEKPPRGKT